MQQLPYVVVTNPHISEVYDLYYKAFDTFRKVPEITTLEQNDIFCKTIGDMLRAHLTVIPKLAMGILECNGLMDDQELDRFMNTVLRSVREISKKNLGTHCLQPMANGRTCLLTSFRATCSASPAE